MPCDRTPHTHTHTHTHAVSAPYTPARRTHALIPSRHRSSSSRRSSRRPRGTRPPAAHARRGWPDPEAETARCACTCCWAGGWGSCTACRRRPSASRRPFPVPVPSACSWPCRRCRGSSSRRPWARSDACTCNGRRLWRGGSSTADGTWAAEGILAAEGISVAKGILDAKGILVAKGRSVEKIPRKGDIGRHWPRRGQWLIRGHWPPGNKRSPTDDHSATSWHNYCTACVRHEYGVRTTCVRYAVENLRIVIEFIIMDHALNYHVFIYNDTGLTAAALNILVSRSGLIWIVLPFDGNRIVLTLNCTRGLYSPSQHWESGENNQAANDDGHSRDDADGGRCNEEALSSVRTWPCVRVYARTRVCSMYAASLLTLR